LQLIPSQGRGAAGCVQRQGGVYTLGKQAAKPLPTLPREGTDEGAHECLYKSNYKIHNRTGPCFFNSNSSIHLSAKSIPCSRSLSVADSSKLLLITNVAEGIRRFSSCALLCHLAYPFTSGNIITGKIVTRCKMVAALLLTIATAYVVSKVLVGFSINIPFKGFMRVPAFWATKAAFCAGVWLELEAMIGHWSLVGIVSVRYLKWDTLRRTDSLICKALFDMQ